jgi:hypothetical protein
VLTSSRMPLFRSCSFNAWVRCVHNQSWRSFPSLLLLSVPNCVTFASASLMINATNVMDVHMFERQYGGVEDHSCLQDSAAAPFSYPCAFVTRSSFGWASNGTMATQLREVQQSCDVSQILSTAHPGIVESCTSCTIRRWRQPRRCVVERSGSCGK